MNVFPLQAITRKKVYLNNIVLGRQRNAKFSVDGKDYQFFFTFPSPDYKPTIFFKIKLSDHFLWLSLDSLPPLSYFSENFEGIELASLPEEIQPIILEFSFKNVLDSIEDELGVIIAIEEYSQTPLRNDFEDELPFSVHLKGTSTRIKGCLHMEGHTLEFLAAILERSSYARKNRFTFVPIPLYVIIEEQKLSLSEFKGLNLNDIILLRDKAFIDNSSCKVVIGNHLLYSGILEKGKLTLEHLMDERIDNNSLPQDSSDESHNEENLDFLDREQLGETSSSSDLEGDFDTEEEGSVDEVSPELDHIPINLVFEVGQKHIPLKELQTLKAGFTFELSNPVERPITIRANGKIIGTGELLRVGERVGVRITSFSNR